MIVVISFFIFFRCFPTCKSTGHITSGFCGNSFDVSLYIEIDEQSPTCHLFDTFWMSDVLYLAEIKCSNEISQERFVSKSDIHSNIKTKEAKCNPYIQGRTLLVETTNSDTLHQMKRIDISFNQDHNAWHYGWISHKCSSEQSHILDIMVLIENDAMNDQYFLAASFHSPEFMITSTKSGRQKKDQTEANSVDQKNSK